MDAVKKLDCEHSGEGEQVSTEFLFSGTLYRLNSPPPGTTMVAGMFVQFPKTFGTQTVSNSSGLLLGKEIRSFRKLFENKLSENI